MKWTGRSNIKPVSQKGKSFILNITIINCLKNNTSVKVIVL